MANGKLTTFSMIDKLAGGVVVVGVTAYVNLPKGTQPGGHPSDRERWENDEYIVFLDKYYPHKGMPDAKVWELSILRKDRGTVHDWRDLQAIKTMLIGPEFEAIELYPAENRVIDVANEAHLFALLTLDNKPVTINCGRYGRREVNAVLAGQRSL